jgi:hypothetical protein
MTLEELIFLIRGAALVVAFGIVIYIFFVERNMYTYMLPGG